MNKVAVILGNYKDYAKKYLPDCLDGLRKQDYGGEIKIYIYDNETSLESYEYLKNQAPEAVIVRNIKNDGFAKGNNDGIKAAMSDGCDYFFCLNLDIMIEPGCISELVKAIESEERVGAVQARLMLWPEKDKINSIGNITHFLGFGYSLGYNQKFEIRNSKFEIQAICYPSGAAVIFKRQALEKVGLYDEEFWMYNEDQDLGWRLWLAGYSCVLAPRAVVFHKYEFSRSIAKFYWMDRNRITVMLKNYRLLTLLAILPAFVFMELGLLLFAYKGGWLDKKISVYRYFFKISVWRKILACRREMKNIRKAKDREMLKMMTGRIWYQEIDDWKLRLANPIFDLYFFVIRKIIIW